MLFWTFQEGFYNQGKLVLNDDKLYFCIKNFTAYFSKKLKDFSISNALTPTILLILHERWLKLIQTFPVCGDYDSFFPYNSSKIWLQISWWLLVPECLNSWNSCGIFLVIEIKEQGPSGYCSTLPNQGVPSSKTLGGPKVNSLSLSTSGDFVLKKIILVVALQHSGSWILFIKRDHKV